MGDYGYRRCAMCDEWVHPDHWAEHVRLCDEITRRANEKSGRRPPMEAAEVIARASYGHEPVLVGVGVYRSWDEVHPWFRENETDRADAILAALREAGFEIVNADRYNTGYRDGENNALDNVLRIIEGHMEEAGDDVRESLQVLFAEVEKR